MNTDILIVGAGLAGLALGRLLAHQGRDFRILEARDRAGGRVLSPRIGRARYDMGPAWFWPGQPRMEALTRALGLTVFDQHTAGKLVFQDGSGAINPGIDMAMMGGSLRIDDGIGALTDRLAADLPPARLSLGHRVTRIERDGDALTVAFETGDGASRIHARQVVLAIPPRLATHALRFVPALPAQAHAAASAVPTWMAGHAKVMAIYPTPFWRDAGLNGDAISHSGPLAEVHDASPMDGSAGALFGFAATPADARRDLAQFQGTCLAHLGSLFGPEAEAPTKLVIQDWAFDPLTATAADRVPPTSHPSYGMPAPLVGLMDGRLHFASTEMGASFGGFLEGALEAAEATLQALSQEGAAVT